MDLSTSDPHIAPHALGEDQVEDEEAGGRCRGRDRVPGDAGGSGAAGAASRYCGQGELYQDTIRDPALNNNQKRTTSIVYRPYSTTNADGGFCRGRTLLHEVGHNLGALQNVAPNAFDGAHCNDDNNDVMCYTDADQFTSDSSTFDFNNNDFWDPATGPLPWWTVNLSRFICASKNCSEFNLLA